MPRKRWVMSEEKLDRDSQIDEEESSTIVEVQLITEAIVTNEAAKYLRVRFDINELFGSRLNPRLRRPKGSLLRSAAL